MATLGCQSTQHQGGPTGCCTPDWSCRAQGRPDEARELLARTRVLSFVLAVAAFVGLAVLRHDLVAFEVTVLMINWSVLIASGVGLGVVFRRAGQSTRLPH